MKNEAPYILEWVAHQKVLGFDQIVVFTNDCTDGTNEILKRLQSMGHVLFRQNKVGAGGIQRSALRLARRMDVVKRADWLFVTDADEFLNIHVGQHKVDDLIASCQPDSDVIAVPWRVFSGAKRPIMRDTPVCRQFTDAEQSYENGGAGRRFFKSLVRNREGYKRLGIHGPRPLPETEGEIVWTGPGDTHRSTQSFGNHLSPPFGSEIAQINHYAVRSAQSYLVKKSRGRANHMGHSLDTGYWDRWNRGGAEDASILRYADGVTALLEEFKSDRKLARLHARGFRWHKAKINELLADPDYAKLYAKIASAEPGLCPANDRRIYPMAAPPEIDAKPATAQNV